MTDNKNQSQFDPSDDEIRAIVSTDPIGDFEIVLIVLDVGPEEASLWDSILGLDAPDTYDADVEDPTAIVV